MNHASDVRDVLKDVVPIHRQFFRTAAEKDVTVAQNSVRMAYQRALGNHHTNLCKNGSSSSTINLGTIDVVFGDDQLELLD